METNLRNVLTCWCPPTRATQQANRKWYFCSLELSSVTKLVTDPLKIVTHELSLMSEESQRLDVELGPHLPSLGIPGTLVYPIRETPLFIDTQWAFGNLRFKNHPSSTWKISHHSTSIATHRVCSTNQRAVHPPKTHRFGVPNPRACTGTKLGKPEFLVLGGFSIFL